MASRFVYNDQPKPAAPKPAPAPTKPNSSSGRSQPKYAHDGALTSHAFSENASAKDCLNFGHAPPTPSPKFGRRSSSPARSMANEPRPLERAPSQKEQTWRQPAPQQLFGDDAVGACMSQPEYAESCTGSKPTPSVVAKAVRPPWMAPRPAKSVTGSVAGSTVSRKSGRTSSTYKTGATALLNDRIDVLMKELENERTAREAIEDKLTSLNSKFPVAVKA